MPFKLTPERWHPDPSYPEAILEPPPIGAIGHTRRPGVIRTPRSSPGMFAGNPIPPQNPGEAATGEWARTFTDDPGLRVAYTTGRRLWHSGLLQVQRFITPAQPNSPENLEAAALQINWRRAHGRFRGMRSPEVVE